ncbi:MAG: serine/threonine protein kinase [Caldilineaceae bacterium]
MDLTDKQLGPYQINSIIGRGGMAVIYRAVDSRNDETVALKVMLPHLVHEPETQHRFQKEGENAKRLIHPNIVRVYEAGQLDGHFYIAMEYAAGGTVAGLLKSRSRPMSVNEALPMLYRVAAALDYAHHRGILHRDVKLSNILIGRNNQILLSDFGIARRIGSDHTMVTTTGYAVGTPAYMSPEQARGDKTIDHRADIYSFGVVAYAILTQAMPFEADTPLVLLRKVIDLAPTPPEKVNPHIPPGVSYVLQRVLAKNPAQRYASATEFVTALEAGVTQTPTAQEWSALTQAAGESPIIPVRPSAPAKTIPAKPPVRMVAPPPPQRTRRGWPLVIGGVIGVLLLWGILQNWAGGLPTLRRADGQLAATSAATASVATVTAAVNAEAANPIVLSSYVDTDWGFGIDIPKQWAKSRQGATLYFEAPDHSAWAFVEKIPANNSESTQQLLADYLASDKTPFHTYKPKDGIERTIDGSFQAYDQSFEATLLGGAQFTGQVIAVRKGREAFIYGISVAPRVKENLSLVTAMVLDSFTIMPESAVLIATTSPSTPTPYPTASEITQTSTTTTVATKADTQADLAAVVNQVGNDMATSISNTLDRTPITTMPTMTTTPNNIRTRPPTSTPVQDTPTLMATMTPTVNQVRTPIRVATPGQATPSPTSAVGPSNTGNVPEITVSLLSPSDGDTLSDRITLSWAISFALPTGYLFEPVFWQGNRDPMLDGRGYGGATKETTLGITAETFRASGASEGEYYWGVLLVKENPYQRVTYLGGKWLLHVKLSTPSEAPIVQVAPSIETIPDNAQVALEQPNTGDTLINKRTFQWTPNFTLPEGYAFEPVFWTKGQSTMQGLGYGGATGGTSLTLAPENFSVPGEYFWGVILVKLDPYQRIKVLSGEHIIIVEFESSSSNDTTSGGDRDK